MKKTLLYPELKVIRDLPPGYEEMHLLKKDFIHLTETIPPVFLVEVDNAYISPFGVVYKHGFVVKESVYSMFNARSFYASFYKKLLLNKIIHIDGKCTIVHNSYFQNYYHWLLEAVPRLYLLKEQAPQLTLILNEDSPGFIKQYVKLFRFKEVVYVNERHLVKADHAIFPTFTSRGLAMYEPIIREMATWLLKENNIRTGNPLSKNIFITRKSAKYRRLINEQEVIDYLSSRNVEIVTLEDLSIREQMQLFAEAKNVIGVQGAGMSNMIYAQHAKLLVTIIHEEHPDDAYFNLANINNTGCYYFQCKGTGNFDYKNNDDLVADMNKFTEVCEKYIFID
ncbi:MAG: hypothetical protein JWN78_595 [Bacteroidota bacterium]|nr:hypothetical protein [Bacteroidota bacterium]